MAELWLATRASSAARVWSRRVVVVVALALVVAPSRGGSGEGGDGGGEGPFLAGGEREGEVPVATRLGGGLRPRDSSKSLSFPATCVHEALHSVRSTPSGDMRVWSSGDRVISSGTRDPGRALSLSLVCLLPIYGPSGTEQAGFSVREVFLVNNDEELEDQWSQLPEDLWDVVDDWPTEQKIQFVKIVTGSDRLPLPRTEMNKVELPFFAFSNRDHANLLRTLPKAHTCENLLEIPNYWESPLQARERAAGGVPEARGERYPGEEFGLCHCQLRLLRA